MESLERSVPSVVEADHLTDGSAELVDLRLSVELGV